MGYPNTISVNEVQIYQEYQIALTTGSASAAQLLAFRNNFNTRQPDATQIIILEARDDNIVFNFGLSTVVASKTLTANALPPGNFSIAKGAIFGTAINGQNQNYVSAIAEGAGSATTFAIVRLGTLTL